MTMETSATMEPYNVAQTLADMALQNPNQPGLFLPCGHHSNGRTKYIVYSFEQLSSECDRISHGLQMHGVRQGQRILLMIRPGIELITATFGLIKCGAVPILIDPGMGIRPFLQCVREAEPQGLIGVPLALWLSALFPHAFRTIHLRISVGNSGFPAGVTFEEIRKNGQAPFTAARTTRESEAAITFTSGSTGIPKGVIYRHGIFEAVIDVLRNDLEIKAGEIDLPGLYILALLNPALGVTTVIPEMDPTRPAKVDPALLVEAIQTFGITTTFGSPTIWKKVSAFCHARKIILPSLRRVLMAGASVPPRLVREFSEIIPNGEVYTPFGATEALPLTNMAGREIIDETAMLSEAGAGVCVGRPTSATKVHIIPISDEPIPQWRDDLALPVGQVGEITVAGRVVTREYLHRPRQTAAAKIYDGNEVWHRMGDLGYFDEIGRLWVCGRKSHRVESRQGLLLPDPCEEIFNHHPGVERSALVGVGKPGEKIPVIIIEPQAGRMPKNQSEKERWINELLILGQAHSHTRAIQTFLFHPSFPVDVRHNAKIQREKLAAWAEKRLGRLD